MTVMFPSRTLTLTIICALAALASRVNGAPSTLFSRGYAVIPTPQQAMLQPEDVEFGPAWHVDTVGPVDRIARDTLDAELTGRHRLPSAKPGIGTSIRLEIRPNSVEPGDALDRDRKVLAAQAYQLRIRPGSVVITANAAPGLFYGVETLAQLLKPSGGKLWLPSGDIKDWPDLQIRNLYWDDAHHLDRPEALKEAIRQASFFKINGFVLKLEGHFQFRHAPAVTEPYALSPAELQDLTDYALRYHVQLIPYLDAPAHIAFILKHPEYTKLRSFPESNYQACANNPATYELFQGMFQDLLDANKGVDYVYVSTDEAYYIGWADNPQCNEKTVADAYGSRGRLLADFVTKVGGYLHDRGRKVVFWGEYPLKLEDIPFLPPYLINGEVYTPEFDRRFRARGIRQMLYTATQGEERVFPAYFSLPDSRRLHPAREIPERASEVFEKISFDQSRGAADILGSVVAGWADAGQHPENFWLGYATGTSAGWHPAGADPREIVSAFFPLFYGWQTAGLERAYQLLSNQAQFWSDSWEPVDSKSRKTIWGSSERIFTPPHAAKDQTLPLPLPPDDQMKHDATWARTNARRLELAAEFLRDNDELIGILQSQILRVDQNRYNLEVLLSNALLCRQNLEFLNTLSRTDKLLDTAGVQAANAHPQEAIAAFDKALEELQNARRDRNTTLAGLTATWEKSWYPRVAEANGRKFLHEVDDVKDHLPDRTIDMSYVILRQLQLPLEDWAAQAIAARNRYAKLHNIAPSNFVLDWANLTVTRRVETTPPPIE